MPYSAVPECLSTMKAVPKATEKSLLLKTKGDIVWSGKCPRVLILRSEHSSFGQAYLGQLFLSGNTVFIPCAQPVVLRQHLWETDALPSGRTAQQGLLKYSFRQGIVPGGESSPEIKEPLEIKDSLDGQRYGFLDVTKAGGEVQLVQRFILFIKQAL